MPTFIGVPGRIYATRGASYTADAIGMIYGVSGVTDMVDLLNSGATPAEFDPGANFRNLIDGGDFTVNPWQRNNTALGSGGVIAAPIAGTVTHFPDRFFAVGGASSAILLSRVADTTVAGFAQSCKHQRQSGNANTAALYFGQALESNDSIRCQGRPVTLSFWAKAGANYSGGNLTAQVVAGTGTDQSAANMIAGAWTGQSTVVNATQALGTLFTRFSFTGTVPVNATQLGVLFSWAPTGSAGADDSVSSHGVQLEVGNGATPYEHRDIQVELEICQRYAWAVAEPAAGVVVGAGEVTGAAAIVWYMATPVQLRTAPTVTVGAGSFKANIAGTTTATTISAGSTHTPNALTINGTGSSLTTGQAVLLQGGGGAGYILASADY